MKSSLIPIIETYINRFQVNQPYFSTRSRDDLSLIIAIPAYKEPNIKATLDSLAKCQPPRGTVEIIIIINAPEHASLMDLEVNRQCENQIIEWSTSKPDFLEILIIKEESLAQKHAGAGLARKIGMDEAVQRWAAVNNDGPIICLDADCVVSENYLVEAEKSFENKNIEVAHFHFEHRYQNEPNEQLRKGIISYELHLRLYVQGLKLAGFPNAVHTVGSCMAVRAARYAKSGGMNRRKAGEDFYFLHKLVVNGGWQDIVKATVYPSCRVSDRVPFGTGRAQMEWLKEGIGETYNYEIYELLQPLFSSTERYYQSGLKLNFIPPVNDFLISINGIQKVEEIRNKSVSYEVFQKHFWQWMDGFLVMKLVHHLRDQGYPNQPVLLSSNKLLDKMDLKTVDSLPAALDQFRLLDASII